MIENICFFIAVWSFFGAFFEKDVSKKNMQLIYLPIFLIGLFFSKTISFFIIIIFLLSLFAFSFNLEKE